MTNSLLCISKMYHSFDESIRKYWLLLFWPILWRIFSIVIWYVLLILIVVICIDSVTRVNDSTHDYWWLGLDSSHVEKNGDSTGVIFFTDWLDSSHNQWLKTRVRVIFTKFLSLGWTNPIRLHTKKWAFCASVMMKIGKNFQFWLSTSRTMLQFKDQVFSTCTEVDLRFCFHWGVSWVQYIDTSSWINVVFSYRVHSNRPDSVRLSLFQIPVKWFKFFTYKSNRKILLKNLMKTRKPNLF